MRLLVQDHTGHTTYTEEDMTTEQMRAKFEELIRANYFAAAGDTLEDAEQVRNWDEALKHEEILILGPQQGG